MDTFNKINNLSREYSYSSATLGQLFEIILNLALVKRTGDLNKIKIKSDKSYSQNSNIELSGELPSELSKYEYMERVFELLKQYIPLYKRPQRFFSLRWNHSKKIPDGVSEKLKEITSQGNNIIFPNFLFLEVKGPNQINSPDLQKNQITIDRFAAESVMIGANMYVPGFEKIHYSFKRGESVAMFAPGNIHVGNGITMLNSDDLQHVKKGIGVKTTESLYSIPSYRESLAYLGGYVSDHSLSPLLGCWLLMGDYKGDELIIDACSAPGHKTCAISEIGFYLQDKFPKIISIDRSSKRLRKLHEDIKRLGLENIEVINKKIHKVKNSRDDLIGAADLVILDPPCSAMGTRPKITNEASWQDFRNYFLLQRVFAKDIDAFVKPNGFLLYNTCTLSLLENEAMAYFISDRLGYRLISVWNRFKPVFNAIGVDLSPDFIKELHSGIPRNENFFNILEDQIQEGEHTSGDPREFNFLNLDDLRKYHQLNNSEAEKLFRTYFGDYTNGYFMALFQKK